MGRLKEAMEDNVLEVATPDETAYARLVGKRELRIWFAPGYYTQAGERRACDKAAQLGRLVWVAWKKDYYRAKSQVFRQELRGRERATSPEQESLRERLAELMGHGESSDGTVSVTSVGMFTWRVDVAPGEFARMTESQFCERVAQASMAAFTDHMRQLRQLRFGYA